MAEVVRLTVVGPSNRKDVDVLEDALKDSVVSKIEMLLGVDVKRRIMEVLANYHIRHYKDFGDTVSRTSAEELLKELGDWLTLARLYGYDMKTKEALKLYNSIDSPIADVESALLESDLRRVDVAQITDEQYVALVNAVATVLEGERVPYRREMSEIDVATNVLADIARSRMEHAMRRLEKITDKIGEKTFHEIVELIDRNRTKNAILKLFFAVLLP
ncbi:MAG: hypothetical protein QXU93_11740 [Thermoproteus sp.]